MARYFDRVEDCVDVLLREHGPSLVLGIPLGIGKPNLFVNTLYQRVRANLGLKLRILTALSLEKPKASSDMEARFLDPFVERVFGNYPDLDYVKDRHTGQLPSNIEVVEFFLKSGDYLANDYAQQNYLNSNYTHVARDMIIQGVNVLAQAVAIRERGGKTEYSLSCNPDVTLDLLTLLREVKKPVYRIFVVNRELPFMENDAIVSADDADAIIHDPLCTHTLFSAPNMKVATSDYAIGLHVSSLVKDGGTLQIGIGSLGDAISHALILRQQHNSTYQQTLAALPTAGSEQTPFTTGLYGCSEMFVNGFMALIEAGILRREVFPHVGLQALINQGRLTTNIDDNTLTTLREARLIHSPLTTDDVVFLKEYGIFHDDVHWHHDQLHCHGQTLSRDIDHHRALADINQHCLGKHLQKGIFMHGGFFLGPRDFYKKLRDLSPEWQRRIAMTRIGFINQLYGQEGLAILQRKDARFVNTCMMVTLLGAAVSDGLEGGKMVSGVGGQYNFVAQAHEIPGARSILMLRATRQSQGHTISNIVWRYPHTTIPRHLRDIVITEYGIADLRGQTDADVIKRLLAITDSRFQTELLAEAISAGKIDPSYEIPKDQLNNLPETVEKQLKALKTKGLLPDFPFGSDFTDEELAIIRILQRIKESAEHPLQLVKSLVSSLREEKEVPNAWLERLQLNNPETLKEKLLRQLFIGNV